MKTIIGVLIAMCVCLSWAHEEHEHDRDARAHGHADEHGHGEERGVEVSEAASKLIGLTTVRAEQRVLDSIVTVPARVVENPKAARTISARIGGFVTYTAAAPQAVAPDERLFEFVSPEAAAQHGELKALESRLEQLTTAGAKNAQLKTDLSIARITYAALTNGLLVVSAEEGRFAQTVPCAGRLLGFEVASGSYVERGAPLARLRAETEPYVLARLPVSEAVELSDGLSASVAGEPGTVLLDRTKNDGLVDVWFAFAADAKPKVRIGESVQLEMRKETNGEPVVAISSVAIFRDGIAPTVLVRDEHDEDRFVTQPIAPGRTANGWTEVSGLEADAEVVVKGLYELRQALPSRGQKKRAAGHFHADGKFHAGGHDEE